MHLPSEPFSLQTSVRWSSCASALALALAAAPGQAQSAPPTELVPIGIQRRPAVEVHFLAYHGQNQYEVEGGGRRCTTPCTLVLPPGPMSVHATGAGDLTAQLVVPHLPSQVRLDHGAPGWFGTAGAVMIPAGLVVGGGFWAIGLACGYSSGGCMAANFVGWPLLGVGLLVTGSVLMGLSNRAPAADANRAEILDARARPRVRFTGIAFAPTGTGAAGAVGFAF
ncbi:MAG: hypothetical protein WCJ30_23400 [Deltaproteobacteria bacterium]